MSPRTQAISEVTSVIQAAGIHEKELKYEDRQGDKQPGEGNRTIGNPRLSSKASRYFEALKKRFLSLEFILIGQDQKENALKMVSQYVNPNKMMILLDDFFVELLVEDAAVKKDFEMTLTDIEGRASGRRNRLFATGACVKNFGIKVETPDKYSFFTDIYKTLDSRTIKMNDSSRSLYATYMDDLLKKVGDAVMVIRSDTIRTDKEKMIGISIDFKG